MHRLRFTLYPLFYGLRYGLHGEVRAPRPMYKRAAEKQTLLTALTLRAVFFCKKNNTRNGFPLRVLRPDETVFHILNGTPSVFFRENIKNPRDRSFHQASPWYVDR